MSSAISHADDMDIIQSAGWAGAISVREVLRLMWEADRHPILGNHDRHEAEALDKKARTLAAEAVSSPDDPGRIRRLAGSTPKPRAVKRPAREDFGNPV